MEYTVELLDRDSALENIRNYYHKYNYIIDSYYEDHILEAVHYSLMNCDSEIGIISIFRPGTIVHFSVKEEYLGLHSELFTYAVSVLKPIDVYVSTENAILLCNALDASKSIENQDCIYQQEPNVDMKKCEIQTIKATVADKSVIQNLDDGFFKNLNDNLDKGQIYIGRNDKGIVCFGIIEQNKLLSQYASIGMFVVKEQRGNGYGSKMLKSLINICAMNGLIPVAGCFTSNKYSRGALSKSGMYNRIKLLKIVL